MLTGRINLRSGEMFAQKLSQQRVLFTQSTLSQSKNLNKFSEIFAERSEMFAELKI